MIPAVQRDLSDNEYRGFCVPRIKGGETVQVGVRLLHWGQPGPVAVARFNWCIRPVAAQKTRRLVVDPDFCDSVTELAAEMQKAKHPANFGSSVWGRRCAQ